MLRSPNLAAFVAGFLVLTSHHLVHGQALPNEEDIAHEGAMEPASEAQTEAKVPEPAASAATSPMEATPPEPAINVSRIHKISIEGSIDAPGRVEALLTVHAGENTPFVPSGDADRVGIPIGTIPRMKHVLSLLGYDTVITSSPDGDGVNLHVRLQSLDRVRHIFVSGNKGIRQQDIIGKLSIRPGQKIAPSGAERDAFIASQAEHIRDFLRSQGYWEAEVAIELHGNGKVPAQITLLIRVQLGPSYPLGPLKVNGVTALPTETIADHFRHMNWLSVWTRPLPFRRSVLRQDITALIERYRKIGFPGVRIQDDFDPNTSLDREAKNVHLAINIKERRHIEVAFEGNHSRSVGALLDSLTLLSHGAYDDVEANASAEALVRSYHEHGNMLAKVAWRRERISEQTDRLVFVIDEGPLLKVRGIFFVGNRVISSNSLAESIRTKPFPFLGTIGLGTGGFASLRQLELDVQSIAEHYAAVGYPDTKVRAEIAPTPGQWRPLPNTIDEAEEAIWRDAKSLYVRFFIEEAPLLWVAEMQFQCVDSNEKLPHDDDFYFGSLRTVLGAPYQPADLKRDEGRLKRALGDDGYRYAEVEAQTTRHGPQINITWRIKLGPQVRVGPVFLRGNFLTTDKTIMTWAELRTGDILTTRALERAQRNLALIQLFNNPNPVNFPSTTARDPVVPMIIEVEERHDHLGVLKIGGGASTDQAAPEASFPLGAYAALGYEHRNLFGHGWTLTSQAAYGSSLTSITSSFLNPRFFGSLFRMEINGSYLRQSTVRLGDVRSGTGSFGFSREMFPGVDANIRYNLRNTSRTEMLLRQATPGPFQDQSTVRIGTFVSSLSAGVEWHRLDHVLVPSRGFKVAAGVEVALPALSFNTGNDTFVKVYGRGLSVIPVLRWLSVRYSIRYDQGLPLGGTDLLPKVERYFAGGDTTIRGYQLDHALTETIRGPNSDSDVQYVQYRPLGGNLRILQNLDLQFPISAPLYGSLFLDSGMVGYSFDDISAKDFRHGLGFSPLLIKLPVGDLSLSFAIPLNRKPGDDTWRLHFNVGLMF